MIFVTYEKRLKNNINSAGTCSACAESKIEYGISGGSFWYFCHGKCQEFIRSYNVLKSL